MRRCLVCDHIGDDAPGRHVGQYIRGVAEQADRERLARLLRLTCKTDRLVEAVGPGVEIACFEATVNAVFVHLDADGHTLVEGH